MPVGALVLGLIFGAIIGAIAYLCLGMGTLAALVIAVLSANLAAFLAHVPNVLEVSIGHALIGEALYAGLETTVQRYLALLTASGGRH